MKIEFTPSFSKQPQKKVTSKKNKLNFKEFLEKVEEENSSV
jgi:mRNA-degrading endonuclease RelE of RelBE toxin-antitoxin system